MRPTFIVRSAVFNSPETPAWYRQMHAIRLARQINTVQLHHGQAKNGFRPLSELPGIVAPDGFIIQLFTPPESLSSRLRTLKLSVDSPVFSGENHVIYTSQPLQQARTV